MSQNIEVIQGFLDACNAKDLDAVVACFTDDAIYHNIPMDPVTGQDGVRAVLNGLFHASSEIDWQVKALAESSEGIVLTERLDRFNLGDRWLELPVMGAFEISNGKISAWRDYFDMKQLTSQMPSP